MTHHISEYLIGVDMTPEMISKPMSFEADQCIKCGFSVTFFQKDTSVSIKARVLVDFKEMR